MLNTIYTPFDYALADFLTERCGLNDEKVTHFHSTMLGLSSAQFDGHSCISLGNEDTDLLENCCLVHIADKSVVETEKPLVLEDDRLYLNRYWRYEKRLVVNVLSRLANNSKPQTLDAPILLDKYFPLINTSEVDWQREAAKSSIEQAFTIITGGPGTGKTSTVLKILALLQELSNAELRISLAAPTGKAAMRLQQSLLEGKQELRLQNQALLDSIPETVSTLHRLLGPINQSNHFLHHSDNPLTCDLLVVDESSMIDLAMMSKLLDALQPNARIILLGDKDQLASVESGSVLNDLCLGLPQQTVELKKTWRFSGPIKSLAHAINTGDADEAWCLLNGQARKNEDLVSETTSNKKTSKKPQEHYQYSLFDELEVAAPIVKGTPPVIDPHGAEIQLANEHWLEQIYKQYQPYVEEVCQINGPEAALNAFAKFQVLAAIRKGPLGVEGINLALEKRLYSNQMQTHLPWYHGKPVMITRNDPALGLFNGDIGICLNKEGQSQFRVWFRESNGQFRAVLPARLPQHETVYAMTIHKSQGSEFEKVMIVLPENPSPVLSKELLYTGVTRAKEQVTVVSGEDVLKYTVSQKVSRNSGIQSKIESARV